MNPFSRRLAEIIIYGHAGLFIYAIILIPIFGHLFFEDVAQMILMGSPLLAMVALAAFRALLEDHEALGDIKNDPSPSAKRAMTVTTVGFLLALFFIYTLAILDLNRIGADHIKIAVGATETALGGYLGLIRDKIFDARPKETP